MKDGFIIHNDYKDSIRKLSAEEKAQLLDALMNYDDGIETETEGRVDILFGLMRDRMDRDLEAYEERANRSRKNGGLGGRPKRDENRVVIEKTCGFSENLGVSEKTCGFSENPGVSEKPVPVPDPDPVPVPVDKKKKTKGASACVAYFDDPALDLAFHDWLDMRKKIRKPATERAIQQAVNKLQKLARGPDGAFDAHLACEIVDMSVLKDWTDFYPLKENARSAPTVVNAWLEA